MLYAYAAVMPAGHELGLRGLDGAAVELLPFGGIAAAISRHAAPLPSTPAHIAEHHRVTLALVEVGGAVPFRFGNVFSDEEQLRQQLEGRAGDLAAKLQQLAGCVEMTLRVNSEFNTQHSKCQPGTRYLLEKKAEAEAEQRVKDVLEGVVKDWRRARRGPEIRLACLVPADQLTELRRRIQGLAGATGPWAPSSFV